jgi:histidinol-phosphate aminotransferase
MDGYTPGEQPGPRERVVKLNTNENPYPPSPRVLQALRETDWAVLRKYPSPMAEPARSAAARLWGVPPECVLCGNGSDELLTMIFRAFVGEGEVAAWPAPTYSLYPVLARIQNARVMEAPAGDDFALPLDDLAGLPARLLVVCNPNAPTGVYTPPEALADLAAAFRGVLVIDEAYADFSPGSAIAAVRGRPNVLVLRTLSKSYSLAGLRFGYAVGPRELIAGLVKVKDSYNCDGVSILAAAAALQDQAWMRAGVEKVVQQRVRLTRALRGLGFAVTPSSANFILAAVPGGDGRRCYEALKGRGILVRWWNLPRLADKVRITVGTPEENDCLLDALDILSKEAAP